MTAVRSWWGWGDEEAALGPDERDGVGALVAAALGVVVGPARDPVDLGSLQLPDPRLRVPGPLRALADTSTRERARHAKGASFRDVVRAHAGRLPHPPDAVLRPTTEAQVAAILDWCSSAGAAVIPFGGGSSVVGGVEPDVGDRFCGSVSLDLGALDGVLEVDAVSMAARVQAGILGPALEAALRRHGLSFRHYPQSFEFSSVGGWLATRSAGHHSTLHTHVDDRVESIRAITPAGMWESRRLPASGAGPSPDRLLLGSEGSLGVIVEAWLRLVARPQHRAAATLRFEQLGAALAAARAVAQSGVLPATCRLLDSTEALLSGAGDGTRHLLLLGCESADRPVDADLAHLVGLARDRGAGPPETPHHDGGAAATWRSSFLRAPYVRDALVCLGLVCETVETAVTWDRLDGLRAAVTGAARTALLRGCGGGLVAMRLTHCYSDGCAPYFTVVAPSRHGLQVEHWDAVKAAVSEAILAAGGSITHHHAVGRDHMPEYLRQRPELFGQALAATKERLDPAGVLNPGVLVPLR